LKLGQPGSCFLAGNPLDLKTFPLRRCSSSLDFGSTLASASMTSMRSASQQQQKQQQQDQHQQQLQMVRPSRLSFHQLHRKLVFSAVLVLLVMGSRCRVQNQQGALGMTTTKCSRRSSSPVVCLRSIHDTTPKCCWLRAKGSCWNTSLFFCWPEVSRFAYGLRWDFRFATWETIVFKTHGNLARDRRVEERVAPCIKSPKSLED